MESTKEFFVENLITLRKKSGLKQSKIAELIGVSLRNYQDYEYGKVFPRPNVLTKIAEVLSVDVSDLLKSNATNLNGGTKEGLILAIIADLPTLNEDELSAIRTIISASSAKRSIRNANNV